MSVVFINKSAEILQAVAAAKDRTLTAMAIEAVSLIQSQMESGYGNPIHDTGNLMRSITYDAPSGNTIHVGTGVSYAPFVHDGTYKMVARPFITDSINNGEAAQAFEDIAEEQLKSVFGG